MKKIIINGGTPLMGEVKVSGSKNAALPIIFSCILINGVSEIENLPDIGDVRVALDLLLDLGATVDFVGKTVRIDTRNLAYKTPKAALVSSIRASTYLLGSCLSRFGQCDILPFGGCAFSLRPIDLHLYACKMLGCNIADSRITAKKLRGSDIIFPIASVGATVNAILLAVAAEGDSVIEGCAVEPHIDSLIDFLITCGAEISRRGRTVFVKGRQLHGGRITIIGDMIEAGSYLCASLMTDGDLTVKNCPIDDMTAFFESLDRLGADAFVDGNSVKVKMSDNGKSLSVIAEPYPGFPTDLQPIFAPIMAKYSGGKICDTVWTERFGYLNKLSDFGIKSSAERNNAYILPSKIHAGATSSPDLRGGFACLIAALSAKGRSEIDSAELILRGYEDLEAKLRSVGADVQIKNT